MKLHSPRSACASLPLGLMSWAPVTLQTVRERPAFQLVSSNIASGVAAHSGHGKSTTIFWFMTDEMQKLKVFLPSLAIVSQSLWSDLLLEVAKTTGYAPQPRAPVSPAVPGNFTRVQLPPAFPSSEDHPTPASPGLGCRAGSAWSSWFPEDLAFSYRNLPSVIRVGDEEAALKTEKANNYQNLLCWF